MSGTYKVICHNRRFVANIPCIRTAIRQARTFSSFRSASLQEELHLEDPTNQTTDTALIWPDASLGPLANKDCRFPLPGSVGVSPHLQGTQALIVDQGFVDPSLLLQTRSEQRGDIIDQFNYLAEMESFGTAVQSSNHPWECSIQECPDLLVRDFQELFPARDLRGDQLTVVTISHHTENDMSLWSPDVEQEREKLLETFMKGGEELCGVLKELGYWADFVDPSSGRPYYGDYTNATLFETDERYRKLGFEIRDLGCCKVIAHHAWGTHTFLGSIFTNCPADDPVLKVLLRKKT